MKQLIITTVTLAFLIAVYLILSFVFMSLDFADWHITGRILFAIAAFSLAIKSLENLNKI